MSEVAAALGAAVGHPVEIHSREPLGGGSINDVALLRTSAGPFVLKSSRRSGAAAMLRAEAAGLEALAASGTPLAVPRTVVVHGDPEPFLVLEYLDASPRANAFDDLVGAGLAALHRATAEQFGFSHDNFCGATPQPNPWTGSWVAFYGAWRIGHQLALAVDAGRLTQSEARLVDRLIMRMGDWIDEPEAPSLIHGDLWSGNLHRDGAGRPALLDPAVYYAHREAEVGMMTLFGGFSVRVFDAYHDAFPLEPGWRDRQPIYQLYHLMNHLNLFGAGYHGQVTSIVRRFA
jgi:fructosamine-3-kinase